jgi:hypothetical protein
MENKLRILINQLVKEELSLFEKKLKKDEEPPAEDINVDLDIPAEEPATDAISTEPTAEPGMDMGGGSDVEKRIGQHLQQALDAAREMPDSENKNKLIRQIGNTALFFLKTQIPVDGGKA